MTTAKGEQAQDGAALAVLSLGGFRDWRNRLRPAVRDETGGGRALQEGDGRSEAGW